MRNIVVLASAAALFAIPHVASAQEGTAAGMATGAVTGASRHKRATAGTFPFCGFRLTRRALDLEPT